MGGSGSVPERPTRVMCAWRAIQHDGVSTHEYIGVTPGRFMACPQPTGDTATLLIELNGQRQGA